MSDADAEEKGVFGRTPQPATVNVDMLVVLLLCLSPCLRRLWLLWRRCSAPQPTAVATPDRRNGERYDGQEAQIREEADFDTKAAAMPSTARPIAVLPAPKPHGSRCCSRRRPGWRTPAAAAARLRVSASAASSDVPDFLSSNWLETRKRETCGPRLNFTAEEAVQYQLESLKYNDHPRQDYGIEIMYQFAEFDPFERSTYFGRLLDLGQFERFRRLFHHSAYRVLLGHKERKILSTLWIKENRFKQRIWVRGYRPGEEQIYQFTMVQRIGSWLDGYWLTESLINDGDAFS